MTTKEKIEAECDALKAMLIAKSEAYGDSATNPVRVFSRADAVEQLRVRIDDKLSRIARGSEYVGDDTVLDLIGYLILYRLALAPDPDERPRVSVVIPASVAEEKLAKEPGVYVADQPPWLSDAAKALGEVAPDGTPLALNWTQMLDKIRELRARAKDLQKRLDDRILRPAVVCSFGVNCGMGATHCERVPCGRELQETTIKKLQATLLELQAEKLATDRAVELLTRLRSDLYWETVLRRHGSLSLDSEEDLVMLSRHLGAAAALETR